jgi:protein ImuA
VIAPANDILARLQRDILPLQGFKQAKGPGINTGIKAINAAFPTGSFPTGAIHEFIGACPEDIAATSGFITGLLSRLMKEGSPCIWIGATGVFPPALPLFNVEPRKVIFLHLKRQKDTLWVMEQALKCDRLAAVVGEIKDISLVESRRLQLAVEQSSVTGLLIRRHNSVPSTIASVSRWKITPAATTSQDGMPGIGLPSWNVELLKVRNGKPGTWQLEWSANGFQLLQGAVVPLPQEQMRNTG